MTVTRGASVLIRAESIPTGAIGNRATVVFANLPDTEVGTFHKVMFRASRGVVFAMVLDSDVIAVIAPQDA
tara:strand:- start:3 stop:215 length:213 start_codon:yes stop_codon:yes gene_type:complete